MTQVHQPLQGTPIPARDEPQRAPRENTAPCDYARHLETEHNLLVEAQQGWPTPVTRYRLFRPLQGKQSEKTLATFVGNSPAALAYFFRYIHPAPRAKVGVGQPAWRR